MPKARVRRAARPACERVGPAAARHPANLPTC